MILSSVQFRNNREVETFFQICVVSSPSPQQRENWSISQPNFQIKIDKERNQVRREKKTQRGVDEGGREGGDYPVPQRISKDGGDQERDDERRDGGHVKAVVMIEACGRVEKMVGLSNDSKNKEEC